MIEAISNVIFSMVGNFAYLALPVTLILSTLASMIDWKRKRYGRSAIAALVTIGLFMFSAAYVSTLNSVVLTFAGYSVSGLGVASTFVVASYMFVAFVKFLSKASHIFAEYLDVRDEAIEKQIKIDEEREAAQRRMDDLDRQSEAVRARISKKGLIKRLLG